MEPGQLVPSGGASNRHHVGLCQRKTPANRWSSFGFQLETNLIKGSHGTLKTAQAHVVLWFEPGLLPLGFGLGAIWGVLWKAVGPLGRPGKAQMKPTCCLL